MKSWTPWLVGLAVTVVISFALAILSSATGVDFGLSGLFLSVFPGVLIGYALFNLSGNRKMRTANAAVRAQALQFQPGPSQAALYLYRIGFVGSAAGMNVGFDGRQVGQLKSPRFMRLDIAPGDHVLTGSFGGGAGAQSHAGETAFTAQAGEVIVFKLSSALGALKNTVRIERMPLETARGDIAKGQMILAESA